MRLREIYGFINIEINHEAVGCNEMQLIINQECVKHKLLSQTLVFWHATHTHAGMQSHALSVTRVCD